LLDPGVPAPCRGLINDGFVHDDLA
jgi:hypothetical protein